MNIQKSENLPFFKSLNSRIFKTSRNKTFFYCKKTNRALFSIGGERGSGSCPLAVGTDRFVAGGNRLVNGDGGGSATRND